MNEVKKFYPKEDNLGNECLYWNANPNSTGCAYPKVQLEERVSCEGIIDDVCLFVKDGRTPKSLTRKQRVEIQTRVPVSQSNRSLPPGDTKK